MSKPEFRTIARAGQPVIDGEFEDPAVTAPARFPEPPPGHVYLVTRETVYLVRVSSIDIRAGEPEDEYVYGGRYRVPQLRPTAVKLEGEFDPRTVTRR
jgi:hypothetical protein